MVVLNHTLLASLSSLSTFIQHRKTSEASEHFSMVTEKIERNLENVLQCIKDKKCNGAAATSKKDSLFEEILPEFHTKENSNLATMDKQTTNDLQEAYLVWEQLQWLFFISGKMIKVAASVKLD